MCERALLGHSAKEETSLRSGSGVLTHSSLQRWVSVQQVVKSRMMRTERAKRTVTEEMCQHKCDDHVCTRKICVCATRSVRTTRVCCLQLCGCVGLLACCFCCLLVVVFCRGFERDRHNLKLSFNLSFLFQRGHKAYTTWAIK